MVQITQKELITLAYKGLETMQQEIEQKKQVLGEMFVKIVNEENAAAAEAAKKANVQVEPITEGNENVNQEPAKKTRENSKEKVIK